MAQEHLEDYMSWELPFYSLVQIFPIALHSDKRGGATIWRDVSKPIQS